MNKLLVLSLLNKPPGYMESLEGWILGVTRADQLIWSELGTPRIRASDGANAKMARFRRTELDRVCAQLINPVINKEKTAMSVEVVPTGPFGHLLERFFDSVTLGARTTERRGVVETITHFDIIPCKELKEIINVTKPVYPLTGTVGRPSSPFAGHMRCSDRAVRSSQPG